MKITQEVRDYAERMKVTVNDSLIEGLKEKSKEFVETGSEIYVRQ